MPAWRGRRRDADVRTEGGVPDARQPRRGLDAHQGIVTLFDGETGIPTAILNASAVTEIRTAAVTAVATRALAGADAKVLAILGAGVQGRAHLRALGGCATGGGADLLADRRARCAALVDDRARARCRSPPPERRERSAGADVVVTATSSREPVLERDWLGAGRPRQRGRRELADARASSSSRPSPAAALFCDSRESLRNEARRVPAGDRGGRDRRRGARPRRARRGAGRRRRRPPRRRRADVVPLARASAIEDLAAAQLAVAHARERSGSGREVRAVIDAGRDRGGARADRRHRGADAAGPTATSSDAAGRDLLQARDAAADQLVQDPRRGERDPRRVRGSSERAGW